MSSKRDSLESHDTQRLRTKRALDVVAVKTLLGSDKDDPVTTVPIKFLTAQADANYSTLMDNSFSWKMHRLSGVTYINNAGKLKVKCRTYLNLRDKLDRLDKIEENPEDHIFTEGGVSAD